jgi:hypothetical protein
MELTNVKNLPDAVVRAIKNDSYDRGDSDYTATQLISPPRQAVLKERHKHEITEDVSDLLWLLYGKISHKILEDHNEIDLVEKRFYTTVLGKKISAQIDTLSLDRGILSDYKFTSSWSFMEDKEAKDDWIAQLNIQKYLLNQNGHKVSRLQIVGLLRDYRKSEAKRNPKYPQCAIMVLPIPIWDDAKVIEYIEDRVIQHEAAKVAAILPRCSSEDRWVRGTSYAVVKDGGVKAMKGGVFFKMDEAQDFSRQNPGTVVKTRPGKNTRCEDYCSVSSFCTQFKMMTKDKETRKGESQDGNC